MINQPGRLEWDSREGHRTGRGVTAGGRAKDKITPLKRITRP